jgi:hypothetical protein
MQARKTTVAPGFAETPAFQKQHGLAAVLRELAGMASSVKFYRSRWPSGRLFCLPEDRPASVNCNTSIRRIVEHLVAAFGERPLNHRN